jgi:hypothetical protein
MLVRMTATEANDHDPRNGWPMRVARIGDGLFFILIAAALVIDLTGGIRLGRGWYRFTATNPANTVMLALVVVLGRHALVRRPSLRARLAARRMRRLGPGAQAPRLGWPSGREWIVCLVVMAAATGWVLQDQIRTITGVPDRGDPMFSMWRLAWVAHTVFSNPTEFWNANIFYPAPNTFAYSDATLLPGLLAAPLLWAGVPLAAVHGLLFVASFFAAGVTMFLLMRAVTGRALAGLFAGVLFAFYPYRFSTFSHIEMQGVFLMPLALYLLLRVLEGGRTRDGVLLGLTVAAEAFWSLYLGAYLAVGLAVAATVRWVAGHFAVRPRARALGAAALVALALLVPYSGAYWTARDTVGERPRDETRAFSAQPLDYTSINEVNVLYGPYLHRHISAERQLFPGGSAAVFALLALVPPVSPFAAMGAAGGLVAFDASLGLNGAAFTWLYDLASPFRAFRVPARFGMVVGLFVTFLAGLGLARLLDRWPGKGRTIAALLIGFAAFELRPAYDLQPTPTAMPAVYDALPRDRQVVIVDLPLPAHDGEYWIDPMYLYYSTFHWQRLVNGFSGFIPVWYPRLVVAAREFPSDESIAVFRKAGAEFLVVHEEFYAERYRGVVDQLDQRRDLELVTARPSHEGEKRLYRLRPAETAGPQPARVARVLGYPAPSHGGRAETAFHRPTSR